MEYFKGEIVKERKKARAILLLDILRQIMRGFIENKINDEMEEIVTHWITKFEREYKAGEVLKKADAEELSKDADKLYGMVARELLSRPIVELTRESALNQESLLDLASGRSNSFFRTKIWEKLPSIAKSDFSDIAKCLLAEASTPATMVALRGMEAVMRNYYSFKIGHECGAKTLGAIIKELRSLPNANAKLLDYIDYLRSEKRNLAQHPDKIFTQREAERIFMQIINAVHDIFAEMNA